MLNKHLIRAFVLSLAATSAVFLATSMAMAAGCSDVEPINGMPDNAVICWEFSQYTVTLEGLPVKHDDDSDVPEGLEKWTYKIQRLDQDKVNVSKLLPIEALFLINAKVEIDNEETLTSATDIFDIGEGDPSTNIGMGDNLRRTVKYAPSKDGISYMYLYVKEAGYTETGPIYLVTDNNKYELGNISFPAPIPEGKELYGATTVISEASDGRFLLVRTDLFGEYQEAGYCKKTETEDCTNPSTFVKLTDGPISLDDIYVCLPQNLDLFPHNADIDFTDVSKDDVKDTHHCGNVEFARDFMFQISERASCYPCGGGVCCR